MWFVLRHWLPLAVAVTLLCGTAFGVAQQTLRFGADELPSRIAEDSAYMLERGVGAASIVGVRQMDLDRTLSPFVIILNGTGGIVASSATFSGSALAPTPEILLQAQENGEHRVTWEPKEDLRFALVIRHLSITYPNYVVIGQSLKPTEAHVAQVKTMVFGAWLGTMLVTLLTVWLFIPRRRRLEAVPAREIPLMVAKDQMTGKIDNI